MIKYPTASERDRHIAELEEAIYRVRKLEREWIELPCVCGYRIPNGNDDDSQCLSCASSYLRAALGDGS